MLDPCWAYVGPCGAQIWQLNRFQAPVKDVERHPRQLVHIECICLVLSWDLAVSLVESDSQGGVHMDLLSLGPCQQGKPNSLPDRFSWLCFMLPGSILNQLPCLEMFCDRPNFLGICWCEWHNVLSISNEKSTTRLLPLVWNSGFGLNAGQHLTSNGFYWSIVNAV